MTAAAEARVAAAMAALERAQEGLVELMLFVDDLDIDAGLMRFGLDAEVWVEADATLLGSHGQQSGTWLWAWANEQLPAAVRAATAPLRALADATGEPRFAAEVPVAATERDAWRWAALALQELGGAGIWRLVQGASHYYVLLGPLRRRRPHEDFVALAERALVDGLRGEGSVGRLNALRAAFPEARVQVTDIDLRGPLHPWGHDLHVLPAADFGALPKRQPRDLSGANLAGVRLDGVNLAGSILREVQLDESSLVDADLTGADLRGASLRGAFLNGANLTRALLTGADLAGAELSRTLLAGVDLSEVRGLDEVRHLAPSEISLSTLIASHFRLEPRFLRRAGVSRGLIDDLKRGQRFSDTWQTVFLSYSTKDAEFAEQLYGALQDAGVRVFWDRFDVLPGEYLDRQLFGAIREHDRLLLVLSPASMASEWVARELQLAWRNRRESLLPVRLCDVAPIRQWTASRAELPDLVSNFAIQDFSGWRQPQAFAEALAKVLVALGGGPDLGRAERPGR